MIHEDVSKIKWVYEELTVGKIHFLKTNYRTCQ